MIDKMLKIQSRGLTESKTRQPYLYRITFRTNCPRSLSKNSALLKHLRTITNKERINHIIPLKTSANLKRIKDGFPLKKYQTLLLLETYWLI